MAKLLRRRQAGAATVQMTRRATVLVVDDVEAIRRLVRTTLEPEFAVVAEAEDGEDAARQAAAHRPDVVVLDLSMPRRDGLQAIEDIRDVSPDSRIVVFTGLQGELIENRVMELGACRFVEKASPLHDLCTELRLVLADSGT